MKKNIFFIVFFLILLVQYCCNYNKNLVEFKKVKKINIFENNQINYSIIYIYNKNKLLSFSEVFINDTNLYTISYKFNKMIIKNKKYYSNDKLKLNNNGYIKKVFDGGNDFYVKYKNNLLVETGYSNATFVESIFYKQNNIYTTDLEYVVDTNKACYYPFVLLLDNMSKTLYFLFGKYINNPIVEIHYRNNEHYYLKNYYDNDGYDTKIIKYKYYISEIKDTIVTDSNYFEIFYEE